MKIILSPSKTMDVKNTTDLPVTSIIDEAKTTSIIKHIKSFSKQDLQTTMSLSDKQLKEVYPLYQHFDQSQTGQAIVSYTGFVFKKLKFEAYQDEHYQYIERHVRILDALYGILKPSTVIKHYRLDFQMKLGLPLYDMWDVSSYFLGETIINLASNEYRKMIKHQKIIDIMFYQNKNGTLKNIPTHTKQARGLMLHYMIQNKITKIDALKAFNVEDYHYSEDLSNAQELVFLR